MEGSTRPSYSPYAKLFVNPTKTVALSVNGHIQVLDTATGDVLHSTTTNTGLREKVRKSGAVVCADVDGSFTYLGVACSDKTVSVWEIDGLAVVSEREAPKKPTDIHFTGDAQKVLISDKFGDVHSFPLRTSKEGCSPAQQAESASSKSKQVKANKRLTDGSLLLGHVSLLTTFLLTPDGKYVITADRDEHIRVSWYPEAYTIERFCLGHTKFVSALCIPSWDSSLLVSGGGDSSLKVWDWLEGKVLQEIPVSDTVMPYVKVVRRKPGRGDGGSDADGDVEDDAKKLGARKKRKADKRKKKAGQDNEAVHNDKAMEVDDGGDDREERRGSSRPEEPPEPLLAIQKIVAFQHSASKFLVFSVHGATALFVCTFPAIAQPSSSLLSPEIHAIEAGRPVLDFVFQPEADKIWILVDASWSGEGSRHDATDFVKVANVTDEKIALETLDNVGLLNSLNSSAIVEMSANDETAFDLYSALVMLPKNLDVEHNAMDDEPPSETPNENNARQLSNKELGRLKSKKAMQVRSAALENKRDQSEAPPEERDTKRIKAGEGQSVSDENPSTS